MILSVRKTMLFAIVVFMLLLTLLSWTVVNTHHIINAQYQAPYHHMACPPPPFEC